MTYADLELSLRRWSGDDYAVELRFQLADAGAEGGATQEAIDGEGVSHAPLWIAHRRTW